ncbi:hypothetical protein O181_108675 [Austropuccinia psidii MF-1]|uniref:Uncharacterized protein n=1 Tax=Austropuccinia psidii MF-1 TaxID=1389203 RepID=A0A9Q3JWW7_9BASI|nr:hypothetical protein [Austropuccinia psidii MF-1]
MQLSGSIEKTNPLTPQRTDGISSGSSIKAKDFHRLTSSSLPLRTTPMRVDLACLAQLINGRSRENDSCTDIENKPPSRSGINLEKTLHHLSPPSTKRITTPPSGMLQGGDYKSEQYCSSGLEKKSQHLALAKQTGIKLINNFADALLSCDHSQQKWGTPSHNGRRSEGA